MISLVKHDIWKNKIIDAAGKKSITLKTTGHEKVRVFVCLAANASGTKL